jgi:hypothetical protein
MMHLRLPFSHATFEDPVYVADKMLYEFSENHRDDYGGVEGINRWFAEYNATLIPSTEDDGRFYSCVAFSTEEDMMIAILRFA